MSTKYSFNWYNWFKKPEEIDIKQDDRKRFQTKHSVEDYPWELKIQDKDIIRSLNRYNNTKINSKEKRSSIKKSKTSLKVRRHKRKKHSHHTQQPKKEAYANKLHKTELGNSGSSKQHRHYKSLKSINDRDKERNHDKDKQYNRDKHSGAGDTIHEKHRKENLSEYRTIQRKEIDGKCEKRRQLQNEEIAQTKARNLPFRNENSVKAPSRTERNTKNENRANREVESKKLSRTRNSSFIEESEEITQNIIDLTASFRDEAKNSASRKLFGTKEEKLINHSLEKRNCCKPTRAHCPATKFEKQNKPVTSLFSKVWPSDNSDEKIAKQSRQISGNSDTSNKSNPIYDNRKQDTRKKPKILSSNCIDLKKKGVVKNNRNNLHFEDDSGKEKLKRNNPKSNCFKDSRTSFVPNCYKILEQGNNSSECNNISSQNNSEKIVCKSDDDSINLISILKEIKSMKDHLKNLSDEDDLKDNNGSKTKNLESRRKLECIEEEIESPKSELIISRDGNLQSVVSLRTIPREGESPQSLNNQSSISTTLSPQYVTLEKSVETDLTQDSSCKITTHLLLTSSMSEQGLTKNPCEIIKTGLSDTKDFSFSQSTKCLSFNEHDCNQFLNKRIFCFKSYIPASERKNKKEVLMKKRLLARLKTSNIPIKRKLDASSSSTLHKMKCSSSSKEDIETPAYDFTSFLKRNIPCTSFLKQNSSDNPFLPFSDISRCTSSSFISREKVCSYTCSVDIDRRAKSESSLKYLKKPQYSTCEVQVFESSKNEEVTKMIKKPMVRKKVNHKRLTIKSKQKSKMKTKKLKQKQMTDSDKHQADNVLKIENLSSHSNSIWKTISIEFNDTCLISDNPLSESRLHVMLLEITEYLKAKAVQPNNLIIKDFDIDFGIDNEDIEEINMKTESSNHADEMEALVKTDACLEGSMIYGYTPSEKSSQTSTNDTPLTTDDTDIKHPLVEIARAIELLNENNEENKNKINKLNDTCKIKFSWLEKTIFDILTTYNKIPIDISCMSNLEQHCYSITNFTFRKSLSNYKNVNYKCQRIEKFRMFSGSNSSIKELAKMNKIFEYHTMESNYNSMELAKNIKKSKISHFTKNIRKIFRVFVGRKKN